MLDVIQKVVNFFLITVFALIVIVLLINKPMLGIGVGVTAGVIYYNAIFATNVYNFFANTDPAPSSGKARTSSNFQISKPSRRSTYEIVIQDSKDLEGRLSKLGGTGKGLHEKTSSVASILSPELVKELRSVATIRNKLVHEEDFSLTDDELADFENLAYSALRQLRNFPILPKVATHRFTCPDCNKTDIAYITMRLAVPVHATCQHCGSRLDIAMAESG
ncbi:hypothetical protein [Enterovibrio sp. FF113]|uniref:hypothetical protein n=1 Tax=Enterovibrio sp. FF113 TaxID=3230010 RepID=UPI00352FA628